MSLANARTGLPHASEIVAAGHALPSDVVDNEGFFARCQFPLVVDHDALARDTRMVARRWCTERENTWTLAKEAVERALSHEPKLANEIDAVVVASGTTMPVLHPPEPDNAGVADLAPLVLRELGRNDAVGLDLKACYCTGFLRGLQVMDGLLANPTYRAGLVIATEQGSRFAIAETNRSSFCFIMSDAAGAVVLRRRPPRVGAGLIDHVGYTFAARHAWVGIGPDAASTVMRGARAGEATFEMLVDCGRKLLKRNGLAPWDVDWFLPIQTHARIVDSVTAALGFPTERLLWNGGMLGFSGSASVPTSLSMALENGTIRPGDLVLSVAVGAGMNAAGTLFRV